MASTYTPSPLGQLRLGSDDLWDAFRLGMLAFALVIFALAAVVYGGLPPLVGFVLFFLPLSAMAVGMKEAGPLIVMMILLPFDGLAIPGLPLQISTASVMAIAGLLFLAKPLQPTPWHGLGIRVALYFGGIALCLILSYWDPSLTPPYTLPAELGIRASRDRGWYVILAVAVPLASFRLICMLLNSYRRLSSVVSLFLAVTAISALWAIYEFAAKLIGLPLVYFNLQNAEYVSLASYEFLGYFVPRSYGTAAEPSYFASFLMCGIIFAVSLLSAGRRKGSAGSSLVLILVVAFIAEALTFSLTGWIATAIAGVVFLFTTSVSSGKRRVAALLIMALVALVIVSEIAPDWTQSVLSFQVNRLEDYATGSMLATGHEDPRVKQAQLGLEVFWEHPLFGVGTGNEPFWIPMIEGKLATSGNVWTTSLSETGVIGSGLLAFLVLGVVGRLYRFTRSAAPQDLRCIASASLAAFVGLLVASGAWGSRLTIWHWSMAGLGFSVINMAERLKHSSNTR